MVESASKIAFQDAVLQFLKRAEGLVYRGRYRKLEERTADFYQSAKSYSTYPEIKKDASVLIFKPDDIGDAIYALPGIYEFKKVFPEVKLYLLCQEKTQDLFERSKLFKQIVGVKTKTKWLRFQSMDLSSSLDKFPVEIFDLAIFLRTYPAYFRYFKKIPAHTKILPQDPRLSLSAEYKALIERKAHQSVQLSEILQRVSPDFKLESKFPEFHWKEEDKTGTEIGGDYIVIHPYARFETRRYPYWRELIENLQKEISVKFVIIGGNEDPKLDLPGTIDLRGKLSLTQSGYLISKAKAFLGNESGPGHWASVLKIPTVMVMSGHSHLKEWGPLGNSLVIKKEVPCQNCYLRACPKYKVRCLTEINPSEAKKQIVEFLK